MRNAGLDETQAGIKIARRTVNNLRYADDNILMAESKEELKSLLMKVKDESEKADLKLNIRERCSRDLACYYLDPLVILSYSWPLNLISQLTGLSSASR